MAWSWSHTPEAYAAAYANLCDMPAEDLRVILAEWEALNPTADDADWQGFSPRDYDRAIARHADTRSDLCAESIWDRAEDLATCDNGGFNAWVCPYGCHTVSFSRVVTDALLDDAEARGVEHGRAAGSWVTDGNTTDATYRHLLRGIEDGDPEVLDWLPSSPLSGEWAGDLLPRDVLGWYSMNEDDNGSEDVLRAYEDGFSRGVIDSVETACRYQLAEDSEATS